MSHRGFLTSLVVAAALTLGACGSDTDPSAAPVTTTVDTASPSTSVPSATSLTASPTTVAPTTSSTEPVASTDWQPMSADDVDMPLAYPCCASNWYGEPSPPLPADGSPLANGVYAIEWEWPADPTAPIAATVNRFESCSVLPEGICEPYPSYAPDEMGVSTESVDYALVLDANIQVIVGGWVPFDSTAPSVWVGTGDDLARLVLQLDADFEAAVLVPLRAGVSEEQIVADLTADPAYGFSGPSDPGSGRLVYSRGDGPQLLFQSLVPYDADVATVRGSHVLGRIALRVADGPDTITVYAGFYS